MKIAIFTETFLPKIDGVTSILCMMLQRLNEHGHQVLMFGPPGAPTEYAGAEIVGVGGPPLPFYPEIRINIPRSRIWHRIQEFQPDLIHTVNPFFLGPFGLSYARRLNVPVVASYHTNVPQYARYYGGAMVEPLFWWYLRTLHNQAHLNLCTSSVVLTELRNRGFNRVRWWKRAIDTQRFSPGPRDEAMRRQLTDGHPEDFLVINIGRHSPEKGLEAIRPALDSLPGVRLALIGGGPIHERLKDLYQGTPTVFPGYLRGDNLIAAYRAADAFILPSTTETFGLVALEAMACRLPVVAARAGGIVDTVIDGQNGLYFDPARPDQLVPLISQLRDDADFRERLAENGLQFARSRSWQSTMDQLIDYYHVATRVFKRARSRRKLSYEL